MTPARRALLGLVLYAGYAAGVGILLMSAANGYAASHTPPQTMTVQLSSDVQAHGAGRPVIVSIIANDIAGSFTIYCGTTTDRISTDVVIVPSTSDLAEVKERLQCRPYWAP